MDIRPPFPSRPDFSVLLGLLPACHGRIRNHGDTLLATAAQRGPNAASAR